MQQVVQVRKQDYELDAYVSWLLVSPQKKNSCIRDRRAIEDVELLCQFCDHW